MSAAQVLRERAAKIVADGIEIGPSMQPCVCGAGRHAHGGATNGGRCAATGCRRYRLDAAWALAYQALDAAATPFGDALREADQRARALHYRRNPRGEGEWSIGASDAGTCPRKIQYRNRPPEDYVPAPTDEREARMGTLIHNEVTRQLRALYPWRQFNRKVTIAGLDRKSELDAFDPITSDVVDIKCTTRDTPILMADGTEKMAVDIRAGDRVVAWDEKSEALTASTVAQVADNGVQPIYHVKTAFGRYVRVTDEHPFLIADGIGEHRTHRWVKAADLEPGMRAVLAMDWTPEAMDDTLSPAPVEKYPCEVENCNRPQSGRPPRTARRKAGARHLCYAHLQRFASGVAVEDMALRATTGPLTVNDGYLLGALVGDGGLTGWTDGRDDGVKFSNIDPGVLGAVSDALRPWRGFLSQTSTAARADHRIGFNRMYRESERFKEWLQRHDMLHSAHDKRVPDDVRRAPDDVKWAFLSGYLDTDGTVIGARSGARRLMWSTVNEALARGIANMLASLGVKAAVTQINGTYKGRPHISWQIVVSNAEGVAILAENLSLAGEKAERLARMAARPAERVGGGRFWNYDLVTIQSIEVEPPEPTVAIEVAETHTIVTGGIITHNTAGEAVWRWLGDSGPRWHVWEQVLLYGLALEEEGEQVRTVSLVYIRRANGHTEEFSMPYDRDAALAARERLLGYAEALDRGEDLPRTEPGPSTSEICRRCFARNHCWSIEPAQRAGRSPENFIALGEDPDADATAWAIREKVEASAARLAAEKEEERAKAIVDGIPDGRYGPNGEWEVYTRGSAGRVSYKASYEHVLGLLDLPDGMRPSSAKVEPVVGSGSQVTKWGKVRKATLDAERKAAARLDDA